MAILKIKQVRELKTSDLDKKLSDLKLELFKEQGNVKMGRPIKNPGKITALRRTISRLSTIRQERKLKSGGK